MEVSCFFDDPEDVGNLTLVPLPSNFILYIKDNIVLIQDVHAMLFHSCLTLSNYMD